MTSVQSGLALYKLTKRLIGQRQMHRDCAVALSQLKRVALAKQEAKQALALLEEREVEPMAVKSAITSIECMRILTQLEEQQENTGGVKEYRAKYMQLGLT